MAGSIPEPKCHDDTVPKSQADKALHITPNMPADTAPKRDVALALNSHVSKAPSAVEALTRMQKTELELLLRKFEHENKMKLQATVECFASVNLASVNLSSANPADPVTMKSQVLDFKLRGPIRVTVVDASFSALEGTFATLDHVQTKAKELDRQWIEDEKKSTHCTDCNQETRSYKYNGFYCSTCNCVTMLISPWRFVFVSHTG
jgi:hypothetical protein